MEGGPGIYRITISMIFGSVRSRAGTVASSLWLECIGAQDTTTQIGAYPLRPLPASILREQIFQIRRREDAGKAFLAQHVGDGLCLALLQFPDFFLDGAGRDEAIGVHRLRLADAV